MRNYTFNQQVIWINQFLIIFQQHFQMKWFQYDNPEYKIKVLDYTYTSEPSINTALPLQTSKIKTILFYLGVILTLGFLWLVTKWSVKKKAIFKTNICSLEKAQYFLIHDEDTQGKETLVERNDKFQIRLKRKCISFQYHDRNYIYIEQKEVFVPIRYEQLGHHLDKLKKDKFLPLSEGKRKLLLDYYGENVMKLMIQSRLDIFIQQMLTPFEVFQTYGIILWIFQQYYIVAFILLAYSLYTYWVNSTEIRSNQQKLAYQSYFDVQTKVLVDDSPQKTQQDEGKNQVVLCTNSLKLDEHRSEIMKDNFNEIEMREMDSETQRKEIQQQVTIIKRAQRRVSKQVKNQQNNLINNRNIRFETMSSHKLVPGDIIILNQLDRVPCDCILLRGEALVNEKYSTGENYLIRKQQIQNFTYQKQNQKSFVLYLGTEIVKIKNIQYKQKKKGDNDLESIQSSMRQQDKIDSVNEIVCLVTQTNFSTLRGKYLRAIRYQNKIQQNFFKETIYFIYIIIFLTSMIYFAYLATLGPYTGEFDMFRIYMDLLITAIPPTLPTILNLGIEFVTKRLKSHGINSVMPKSILTGGKIDTIILKGDDVFGKEYNIQSAAIGTKGQRGFGLTFSTVNQFQSYHDREIVSFININDLQRKTKEKTQFYKIGTFFIDALTCCHTLQFFNKQVHGSVFEKKIFEFTQSSNTKQDEFQTLHHKISVKKIIHHKSKVMKLGVLAFIQEKEQAFSGFKSGKNDVESLSQINQNQATLKYNRKDSKQQYQVQKQKQVNPRVKKYIFIKGTAQKILKNCAKHTYPENSFDYIVDMAEKGFILYSYAMKELHPDFEDNIDYLQFINRSQFTFLGFVIMEQVKLQQNLQAIKNLNDANVKIIFVSEQRQLQAASKAMFNGICNKNQLLLCDMAKNKEKIICKGHIEWESTTNQIFSEFITEFQEFGNNSKVSLSSYLYEQLFMKRDMAVANNLFHRSIVFNKMQIKHQKNLNSQLEKRNKVCCAVGRSGSLYQTANLTLQLERQHGALLSSFYTNSTSLQSIVTCLRICRAGLSTNLHGFGMMILFSMIQFTTLTILNLNYQNLTSDQSIYQDLFITFPIFITINLTQPSNVLSKQLPPSSFFSLRNVISMAGQLIIQFLAQLGFILYVLSLEYFKQERQDSQAYYMENGNFRVGSSLSLGLFVLSNNLYLGIVLSTSVSKPFRKPFYTNPFYTINLILIWCYNTFLVIFPKLSPTQMRSKELNQQSQFILVVALLVGNLMMVIMYLYENLLVFLWTKQNICLSRKSQGDYQMDDSIK